MISFNRHNLIWLKCINLKERYNNNNNNMNIYLQPILLQAYTYIAIYSAYIGCLRSLTQCNYVVFIHVLLKYTDNYVHVLVGSECVCMYVCIN